MLTLAYMADYDPSEELDVSVRGWAAGCPPGSAMRKAARGLDIAKPPKKSFVADISANTDLCSHPHLIDIHGITAGKAPNVAGRLEAMFSLSKTSLHTDVLAVPVEQWVESLPSIEWSERNNSKLLWRGSNTGVYHSSATPWRESHRTRLVRTTNKYADGEIDILPTPAMVASEKKVPTLQEAMQHLHKGTANARLFDISFAGRPIQCEVSDGTCRELAEEYDFKTTLMTFEEALEYKYVLDVDGNSVSRYTCPSTKARIETYALSLLRSGLPVLSDSLWAVLCSSSRASTPSGGATESSLGSTTCPSTSTIATFTTPLPTSTVTFEVSVETPNSPSGWPRRDRSGQRPTGDGSTWPPTCLDSTSSGRGW